LVILGDTLFHTFYEAKQHLCKYPLAELHVR